MKKHYRLALPPLSGLTADTLLPFAVLDDSGHIIDSGRSRALELAAVTGASRVHAILHPLDAVVAQVTLPPLSPSRTEAAVQASIETLAVQDPSLLAIAFGRRTVDGQTPVAWADKALLLQGSRLLYDAGLRLDSLVPHALALPVNDPAPRTPLGLPADQRWTVPLPAWSLAQAAWRPATEPARWRPVPGWALATLALWALGLNLYAAKLEAETARLKNHIEQTLAIAFPEVDVWLDPMKQAQQQISRLQSGQGKATTHDFMSLALAASHAFEFPVHQVQALHYSNGSLALTVGDAALQGIDEASVARQALSHALRVRQDAQAMNRWYIERVENPADGRRP